MIWLDNSIMHTRGVAGGKVKETHQLTEKRQATFQYTIGPYSNPVLQIRPGDRIVVETVDTFGGAIRTELDLPTQKLRAPFLNPQCGPIMVEGATKGDVLAVYIESIVPRGQNPRGTVCMIPGFGGLTGTYYTATLNEPLPERVKKLDVDETNVCWSDTVILPYRLHIGAIGCSPGIAYRELVLWMEREYGFERWEAYMILGQCGIVRLGNFVDPKYSVGAAIRKTYLAT